MKKLSLIIPIYNTEKYLEQCLRSAVMQTYPNMEIICIDDGSTDSSGKIADRFAELDSRIFVLHQQNQGESNARNQGLFNATGEYIAFMDCDDWIDPDMYSTLAEKLEQSGADIAISGWFLENKDVSQKITNKKRVREEVFGREDLIEYLYERDSYRAFAYMWNKLYRRELLFDENKQIIQFDEKLQLGGDVLFLGEVALKAKKAVYTDAAFYHYRQREDSGCRSLQIDKRMDWIRSYMMLIDLYSRNNISSRVLGLLKRFLAYHCSNLAELAYEQEDRQALEICQNIMKKYQKEYQQLNSSKPEWIERYNNILKLTVGGKRGKYEVE